MTSIPTPLLVVPTGAANLAAVFACFRRLGAEPVLSSDPDRIAGAERVILPGVGAFGPARVALAESGADQALLARIEADRPTLAICLGMHLLSEGSDEAQPDAPASAGDEALRGLGGRGPDDPGSDDRGSDDRGSDDGGFGDRGLGVLPGRATRFTGDVRIPQMGWNRVSAPGSGLLTTGDAYFANSFRIALPDQLDQPERPDGWTLATTDHGGPFLSAAERGRTLVCQFHPELSGPWGAALMERWYEGGIMLTVRVIPCLDVRDGSVVKGVRFQNLKESGDPAELSARYASEGADELVLLDVSATPEGRQTALHTVSTVRDQLNIPLTVGGGVSSVGRARDLLEAGADKVSVNTAAVERPELVRELADQFGTQCVVLAIDAAGAPEPKSGYEVVVRSGTQRTGIDAVEWARRGVANGAGEILLTSFDRDGTRAGYDVPLIQRIRGGVDVPIIASGGASTPEHMVEAVEAGADAVLAASIFHESEWAVYDLKERLAELGMEVRR